MTQGAVVNTDVRAVRAPCALRELCELSELSVLCELSELCELRALRASVTTGFGVDVRWWWWGRGGVDHIKFTMKLS